MRHVICVNCASKVGPMHGQDKAMGFKRRLVHIEKAKRPADLAVDTYVGGELDEHREVPVIVCDHCDTKIPDGQPCVAISMWRGEEMDAWESDYSQDGNIHLLSQCP